MFAAPWIAAMLLSGVVLAAPNPNARRLITAVHTGSPPLIDAKLTDDCWQAAEFGACLKPSAGWQPGRPLAVVAMAWDDMYLYVAVLADEPRPADVRAKYRQDQTPLWEDDSLEIFLAPPGQGYLQLLVNLNGARWLARGQAPVDGRNKLEMIDPTPVRVAVIRQADGWAMEIAMPLALVPGANPAGGPWGLNWRRYRYAGDGPPILSWCRLPNVPAHPELFGRLVFAPEPVQGSR